jgi:hypothetical protein
LTNVAAGRLRVRILIKSLVLAPEKHDHPVTAGLPLAGPGYPHFIHVSAQVGIRLSRLKLFYHVPKLLVADILFSGKPGEPCIFENPHWYIIL